MNQFDLLPLAFSVKDACQALSIGKTTIFALLKEGRLRAVKIGGRTLIPTDSIRSLLNGESGQ